MKEIMMPVLVMDDECTKCEDLDIYGEVKGRLYAGEDCVHQEIQIRCRDVYKCKRLMKRLEKKNEG